MVEETGRRQSATAGDATFQRLRAQAAEFKDGASTFGIAFAAQISMRFSPHAADRGYYDDLVVIATPSGVGAAFCPHREAPRTIDDLLSQDARHLSHDHRCIEVAAVDAAFGTHFAGRSADLEMTASGSFSQRSDLRATLIANELARLQARSVLMIGAVGSVLRELSSRGLAVAAVDMDPEVIGVDLGGVTVSPAEQGAKLMSQADAAVVTGMTMTTETFDDVLANASDGGVRIVMFSQTGANYGPDLLDSGVEAVITEGFPFYMFPGSTTFKVYRKKER